MGGDASSIVSALIEAGNVDTMYRDVYLGRARTLLGPVVSIEDAATSLAGGDARHGGLYDLLGVGRDDDSDRLVARFAVVHRERMVAW